MTCDTAASGAALYKVFYATFGDKNAKQLFVLAIDRGQHPVARIAALDRFMDRRFGTVTYAPDPVKLDPHLVSDHDFTEVPSSCSVCAEERRDAERERLAQEVK